MEYRILIRPQWTLTNGKGSNMWRVEFKLFNMFWIENFDKWHTRKEAEQWVADRRNILKEIYNE